MYNSKRPYLEMTENTFVGFEKSAVIIHDSPQRDMLISKNSFSGKGSAIEIKRPNPKKDKALYEAIRLDIEKNSMDVHGLKSKYGRPLEDAGVNVFGWIARGDNIISILANIKNILFP